MMIVMASKKADPERNQVITEVYTNRIPRLECVKKWFARDTVEFDFGEEFEVRYYKTEEKVGRRTMCCYRGNFIFAPDVEVSVYEAKRFLRVYLKYDKGLEDSAVEEVRARLSENRLERRLPKFKKS